MLYLIGYKLGLALRTLLVINMKSAVPSKHFNRLGFLIWLWNNTNIFFMHFFWRCYLQALTKCCFMHRMPVFLLYICAFLFDVAGVKKYGRRGLIYFVNLLKTRGGIQEIYRIMWYPGYISPYDDSLDWLRDS